MEKDPGCGGATRDDWRILAEGALEADTAEAALVSAGEEPEPDRPIAMRCD